MSSQRPITQPITNNSLFFLVGTFAVFMSLFAMMLSYFIPFDKITVFILLSGQKTSATPEKREEFTCPFGYGNGNFADPVTCRRFYQVGLCKNLVFVMHRSYNVVVLRKAFLLTQMREKFVRLCLELPVSFMIGNSLRLIRQL